MGPVTAAAVLLMQVSPTAPPVQVRPAPARPDDIVVQGYRDRLAKDRQAGYPPNTRSTDNRRRYDVSARLARCAARAADPTRLRAVVDGAFGSGRHHVAQDRLVRAHIACSESATLLSFTSVPVPTERIGFLQQLSSGDLGAIGANDGGGGGDGAPLGYSIYDRGAFTIQALKRFAPDLQLTGEETGDPVVQARFNAREVPLNASRDPVDRRYFETAVCMVRMQPGLAVRLAYSDGAATAGDLQNALIDRARPCVGGARKVRVDPTQFRMYVADAVYRWAVAARGVDTLIPVAAAAGVSPGGAPSPS